MEAVKLAPTLVPAAVLASKYQSEAHQVRRAMRHRRDGVAGASRIPISPMPMRMSGSAIRRGSGWCGSRRWRRKRPAIWRARWRWRAPPSTPANLPARAKRSRRSSTAPTQRVAMLMAEIERSEHGDSGRARAWTLRAVRALHDPVWTADGYVSDRWRPVSPVTGRLDAFQWQTPLAALPSDKAVAVEAVRRSRSDAGAAARRRIDAARDRRRAAEARRSCRSARRAQEGPADRPPSKLAARRRRLFRARQDVARKALRRFRR